MNTHHDVLIVGGGNAGISLAAHLRRLGCRDVAVVDPAKTHTYRPLLSYVGAGRADLAHAQRPQGRAMPSRCHRYAEAVVAVDPERRAVVTDRGREISGNDLVLCPGSSPDWDAAPGTGDAVVGPAASTNYLPELAAKTWTLMSSLTSGRAVFTVATETVPCGGVGYKPLFILCDLWRRRGVLGDLDVTVLVEDRRMFALDRPDEQLRAAAERYGVRVVTSARVGGVDPEGQVVRAETPAGAVLYPFDALHLTPRHRAPEWIGAAGLSGLPGGFAAVDPETLRHPEHPRVWAMGDAAELGTQRSGGGLRKQVPILARNIAAQRLGRAFARYDGYSVAPIATSGTSLLLAEFDRRGRPTPSFGLADLQRSRPWTYAYDLFMQPQLYWHGILKGRVGSA